MTRKREVNAVLWSGIERFSAQGVQFILSIIIARLITPSDYGLIAMLSIFLSVAQQFVDSGFSSAIIQKNDRKEIDFYTVFYFNLIVSVLIYIILFFVSSYIAEFYSETKLEIIAKWIGLNIILTAFYIVPQSKFVIELNFKKQAKISFISVFVSGIIGVILAWWGYGVWALVCQSLLNNLLCLLLYWIASRWKLRLKFSWSSFKSLYSFGSKLLVVGILHVIFGNIYTLVIGRRFASVDVGYFNRSQSLATFPSMNISSIIARVLYPIQCEIQSDNELLKIVFVRYLKMTLYVVLPLMMGLCILSRPFVEIVLTKEWLPVANILSLLCIAYMCYPFTTFNWQLLAVKGRTDLALKAEICGKLISFIILILVLPYGVTAICYGIIIANVLDTLIIIYYVKKVVSVTYWLELKLLFPILAITTFMGISISIVFLIFENRYLQLFVGFFVGAVVYVGLSYVLGFKEVKYILNLIFRKNEL